MRGFPGQHVSRRGVRRTQTFLFAATLAASSLLFAGPTAAAGTIPVQLDLSLIFQSQNPGTGDTIDFGSTVESLIVDVMVTSSGSPVTEGTVQLTIPSVPGGSTTQVRPDPIGHAMAVFGVSTLPVGPNDVIAQFIAYPDSLFANSDPIRMQFTVSPARTRLDIRSTSPVEVGIPTDVRGFVRRYDDNRVIPSSGSVFFTITDPSNTQIVPPTWWTVGPDGSAQIPFTPMTTGTYGVHGDFMPSDLSDYQPASGTAAVLALDATPTVTTAANVTGTKGQPVTLSASVTSDGSPLTSGYILFSGAPIGSYNAPVQPNGTATFGLVLSGNPGVYPLTATFNRGPWSVGPLYASSTAAFSLTVNDGASGYVGAGGSITTGATASSTDPIETTVTTPNEGTVTIAEQAASIPPPVGYAFVGQSVDITAPAASASSPLVLVFTIDASIVPAGVTAATLQLFRNGVLVPDCLGATQAILYDPCLSNRETLFSPDAGDIRLTALTSAASEWSAGYVPFVWSDFRQPVDPYPTLNKTKAGSAIPVRFSLGGDHGLTIFAPGYPGSSTVACSSGTLVDTVEETVNAGASSLSYDRGTGLYTYIWKTDKAWAGTCRQLVLTFSSSLGTQRANFQFTR